MTPLRLKRILREMSLHEVSKKTGIDAPKLSLIERGLVKAHLGEILKLSSIYDCNQGEIFNLDGYVVEESDMKK